MRFVASWEALFGFAIVTASVSSIVLIFPALTRMRHLALGLEHLAAAERRTGLTPAAAPSEVLLAGLARDVTRARIDLVHFPILYYFAGERPGPVRPAAASLDASVDSLAELYGREFTDAGGKDRDAIFDAVARYHCIERAA
jgi:hypothetical protein